MKTDSLLYALFQSSPEILFELIGRPVSEAQGYRFASEEVKQTAFRVDGVFLPPSDRSDAPTYFLEAQMQRDPLLYRRLFAEIFLYLRQHPEVQRWQAVVIYPNSASEFADPVAFGNLLQLPEVSVVYLSELEAISELSPELGTLRLMVEPAATVPEAAKGLMERVQRTAMATTDRTKLLELIETLLCIPFPACHLPDTHKSPAMLSSAVCPLNPPILGDFELRFPPRIGGTEGGRCHILNLVRDVCT